MTPRLAIGADDAGFDLKRVIAGYLHELGVPYEDVGIHDPSAGSAPEPVDYPDVAKLVALGVHDGHYDRGILICGTGIGMAITANKVPGVRAAQAHDVYSAERARKSNDAQVLAIGSRVIGPELAKTVVKAWLEAEFAGGPSARKVAKIGEVEAQARALRVTGARAAAADAGAVLADAGAVLADAGAAEADASARAENS